MDVYQVPKRSIILIKVFISLAILAILFALTDVTKMLSVMMDINPLVILFSVFLCFSRREKGWIFCARRYFRLVSAFRLAKRRVSFRVTCWFAQRSTRFRTLGEGRYHCFW